MIRYVMDVEWRKNERADREQAAEGALVLGDVLVGALGALLRAP